MPPVGAKRRYGTRRRHAGGKAADPRMQQLVTEIQEKYAQEQQQVTGLLAEGTG